MRLVSHLFSTSHRQTADGVIELVNPRPGVIVPPEVWGQLGPERLFAGAEVDMSVYLGLIEGAPGRHILRFFFVGTTPPEAHGVLPSQLSLDAGAMEFDWPAGDAFISLVIELQDTRVYVLPPVDEDGWKRSPVDLSVKILADGEPLADLPVHVFYDLPES
jgi:hypothetical protein